MISLILATALLTRVLSSEEFGLWAVTLSLVYFSLSFDFGLSGALRNRLVALSTDEGILGKDDERSYFLSVLYLLTAIAGAGALLSIALVPLIPWAALLGVTNAELGQQAGAILAIVISLLLLGVPLTLCGAGFYAYDEAHISALLSMVQSVIMIGGLGLAAAFLPFTGVVTTYYGLYVATGLLNTAVFLHRRGWPLGWFPLAPQIAHVKSLARGSLDFWVLGTSAVFVSSTGTILAGAVGGVSAAGDFSLIQRLFGLLATLHISLLAPVVPAYTRAARQGDWGWVAKTLAYTTRTVLPLIFCLCGSAILVFHPVILRIWTGKDMANYALAGYMAVWALATGWVNTYAVLLNALGVTRLQAAVSVFAALIIVPLTLNIGQTYGTVGVTLAAIICLIPGAIALPVRVRRALAGQEVRS
ncbi:MAG: lipopolysaccharide biosynthesis protein [Chloroflexota bacterium]